MPRYYFDVHDKEGTFRDDVGLELPNMQAAIAEARRALADMSKELVVEQETGGMHITIHDGKDGPVRLTVSMHTTWPDGTSGRHGRDGAG